MRCLTLADALRERGARCTIICRPHIGHLLDVIAQRGHSAKALPSLGVASEPFATDTAYGAWLGTDWQSDAQDTQCVMGTEHADWLVVDHYALDRRWEQALRPHCRSLMVIDDLADRPHDCDLLLDQTFGRSTNDYRPLVLQPTQLLCGSQYALLRPEFATLREYSLKRRANPALKKLLITMGGVDKDNVTGEVLEALCACALPEECRVIVVMGSTAPWLREVKSRASTMPWPTCVLVGVNDMAQLMADSDLAIGAAGATSWERCCLGLPSIMLVVADNQQLVAKGLEQAGAAVLSLSGSELRSQLNFLLNTFSFDINRLVKMSDAAASIVDGGGVNSVLKLMEA